MNATMTMALFKDALYQVLDNRVFRILVVVAGALVSLTFLIAAKSDEVVLLFGWKSIRYEDIFRFFSMPITNAKNPNEEIVQAFQSIIVDGLAGTFGIIIAIAATAFFLPRMLEKGGADTIFSKPVSRLTLMLSRYFAGLIFVALLALFLVGGMHVGLMLNSGYSDPGFLWSIPITIYVFGMLHGFSMLVGVMTRSTVASILVTLMFFAFNGCVHGSWTAKEIFQDDRFAEFTQSNGSDEEDETSEDETKFNAWKQALFTSLDVLHYTLPKTSDASMIAQSLRKQLERMESSMIDPENELVMAVPLDGFERTEAEPDDGASILAHWRMEHPDGLDPALVTVRAQPTDEVPARGSSSRRRPTSDAAEWIEEELGGDASVSAVETARRPRVARMNTRWVEWSEARGERTIAHRQAVFDWEKTLYRVEVEGEVGHVEEEDVATAIENSIDSLQFEMLGGDPHSYMMSKWGWNAPLKYNFWFSIASSLAFVLVTLALAWWRLSRIDF